MNTANTPKASETEGRSESAEAEPVPLLVAIEQRRRRAFRFREDEAYAALVAAKEARDAQVTPEAFAAASKGVEKARAAWQWILESESTRVLVEVQGRRWS